MSDWLIIGGLVVVLWAAGYPSLAVITLVLFLIVGTLFREKPMSKEKANALSGVKISGPVEVLEPIVIETRRNLPFKVPESSSMTLLTRDRQDAKREKISDKLFYSLALLTYRLFGGKRK